MREPNPEDYTEQEEYDEAVSAYDDYADRAYDEAKDK